MADGYVGMVKGVIYSLNPSAVIVDLSHHIQPQNIRQAAFLLFNSYSYFPVGAIHLAVVDPGVGTARKAICLHLPGKGYFVGPDNGLFSYILEAEKENGLQAWELAEPAFQGLKISPTFHGRDIFAPAAAHLTLGENPENFGPAVLLESLVRLKKLWPEVILKSQHRVIRGSVTQIDRFGNITSNIALASLGSLNKAQSSGLQAVCGNLKVKGLKQTYGQAKKGELLLLAGSSGYLEIACSGGSAAARAMPEIIQPGAKFKVVTGEG